VGGAWQQRSSQVRGSRAAIRILRAARRRGVIA